MRVMTVDDSSVMRKIISRGLRQAGFEVADLVEAGNGAEALEKLKVEGAVDLVLCDWNMPVMDGLEFVKGLRSGDPGIKEIPVVMITTEGGEEKVNAAIEAGANGHIKKPFTPDMLKENLGQFMK